MLLCFWLRSALSMPDPASILPAVCHLSYTHLCYSLAMSRCLRHHYGANLAGWSKMLSNGKALGEWFNQAVWLYAENLSPRACGCPSRTSPSGIVEWCWGSVTVWETLQRTCCDKRVTVGTSSWGKATLFFYQSSCLEVCLSSLKRLRGNLCQPPMWTATW